MMMMMMMMVLLLPLLMMLEKSALSSPPAEGPPTFTGGKHFFHGWQHTRIATQKTKDSEFATVTCNRCPWKADACKMERRECKQIREKPPKVHSDKTNL